MNYLSLYTPDFDRSEIKSSSAEELATWLSLSVYCASQENGGVITDMAEWGTRMWQNLCYLPSNEVMRPHRLWDWDGKNLTVWNYNKSQEEKEIQRKRASIEGGKKSAESRKKQENEVNHESLRSETENTSEVKSKPLPSEMESTSKRNPNHFEAESESLRSEMKSASNEGKGKEGKSREENGREVPPSLERSDKFKARVIDKPEVLDEVRGVGGRSEEELEARDKSVKTIGEIREERLRKRADERKAGDGGMNRISDVMSPSGMREPVFDDDSSSTRKPEPEELVRQMLGIEPPRKS